VNADGEAASSSSVVIFTAGAVPAGRQVSTGVAAVSTTSEAQVSASAISAA
jgi:hypothetical protein